MRILLISNMFPPDSDGGLEMNAWKVASGLRKRGHDVTVLASRFRKGFVRTGEEPDWVHRVLRLTVPWPASWVGLRYKPHLAYGLLHEVATLRRNVRTVERWARGRDFDVVYCFGMSLIGPGVTLPFSRKGTPILWHQGGGWLESRFVRAPVESVFLRLRRHWLALEDDVDLCHVAFVSRFLLDKCTASGFFDEPNRGSLTRAIIPRGVDFPLGRDTERKRSHPPVVLMAGRLLPIKGFHLAIEAAEILAHKCPALEWELHIVGEADNLDIETESGSSYQQRLVKLAAGLGGRVRFLGKKSRSELLALMRSATGFVSASVCGEGFANTIIEALGSGTPLIVSNDGSALEVVTPGISGLVYEKDDVQALSAHMQTLLTDPNLRLKLAQNGLATISQRYTMDAILDETERVLGNMLASSTVTDLVRESA